jgi:hypothetical protein
MHFAQHWILSWFIAEGGGSLDLRQRRIVTWAGLLPDADVAPYAAAAMNNWLGRGQGFAQAWNNAFNDVHLNVHHHYTHGVGFVALTGLGAYALARLWTRRGGEPADAGGGVFAALKVALLAAVACALHCLTDVIASGPTWPIYPLWPFSNVTWGYPWSWTLADWPNLAILGAMLLAARQYAKWKGRSPLEALSARLDARLVTIIGGTHSAASRDQT